MQRAWGSFSHTSVECTCELSASVCRSCVEYQRHWLCTTVVASQPRNRRKGCAGPPSFFNASSAKKKYLSPLTCGPNLLVGKQIGFCLVFSFFAETWIVKSEIKVIVCECWMHSATAATNQRALYAVKVIHANFMKCQDYPSNNSPLSRKGKSYQGLLVCLCQGW